MKIKYKIIPMVIISLLLLGCSTKEEIKEDVKEEIKLPEEKPAKPEKGGELKISINDPIILNPILNNDESIDQFLKLIYEPLFYLDENNQPIANLVEDFQYVADGTLLNIKLKEDSLWQDGEKLTSKDVIFTLDTIKSAPDNTMYKKSLENIAYYKVIDEFNLKVGLKQPYSGMKSAFCFPILPKHYYKGSNILEDVNNQKPLGNGRYKFVNYIQMKEINLVVNENWFGGNQYIEKIKAIITRNDEAKSEMLNQKLIDLLFINNLDVGKYLSDENFTVKKFDTNYYDFLGFNFENNLLDNQVIRQAIAYSLNRDSIINDLFLGFGEIVDTPIKPNSQTVEGDTSLNYSYDLTKAKTLLVENEWSDSNNDGILDKVIDGTIRDLSFDLLVNESNVNRVRVAEFIKKDLKQIGIEIKLDTIENNVLNEKLKSGDYDIILGGWRLSPILDFTFAFGSKSIETGTNFINYNSSKMDSLLNNAFVSFKDKDIVTSYNELSKYIKEDLPYVSLYFRKNAVISNQTLKGELQPNSFFKYNGIENCYIEEKVKID